jgi:RNA polymerase sigma factor (sigma-70 family)
MDAILLPYLQATNESEKQERLDELLLVYASPVVRFALHQRLGFTVTPTRNTPGNPDAEDLHHEILTKIVEFLRELERLPPDTNIHSFRRYVARLATNACHDYLRRKSPARARLKNNLRDLLNRHPDFDLRNSGDEWIGGLRIWRSDKGSISSRQEWDIEARLSSFRSTKFPGQDVKQVPLSRIVADFFYWLDAPIELDTLVNLLAKLLDVKDHPPESLDDEARQYLEARLANTTLSSDSRMDLQATLAGLWEAVKRLPANQRDTFCLSFTDQNSDDFFSVLLEAEIVSLPQIAQALNRTPDHLLRIWSAIPMDRAAIAVELGATIEQVSKWRFRALKRLEKEILSREWK